MTDNDRTRLFRGMGLALAALLLVGGSVLGSQLGNSGNDQPGQDDIASPSASSDDHGTGVNGAASEVEDASESPEASPEANDVNDANEAAESQSEDASDSADPSESPDASGSPEASPDDSNSGKGGGSDD